LRPLDRFWVLRNTASWLVNAFSGDYFDRENVSKFEFPIFPFKVFAYVAIRRSVPAKAEAQIAVPL
jgi:hypothetical protein